ncbi:MAG: Asp-tRNA(Asn)/Glu-tRNA(Gln) amidotransferase subunit GatB [Patescibacteria group bacterium]
MAEYRPTIGLEIHAELATRTKMFCSCRNDPDEKQPNTNVCAVCLAHPGALPVINKEAVRKVLLVGTALGGTLADFSEFDRKNYFYPDIPKGYQISQYKYPLVSGGELAGVQLTRIHLEEDTARSQHEGAESLIDYNRAGVPLMELVTEPVIHDAKTASAFARELQLLLRTLGAGEANMEKGEMRVEANISVSTGDTLGTKVEVKNLNSFRSVEGAVEYEIQRQTEILEAGGTVDQETRGWDEIKQVTFSQRKKESSHDYRYFPDPDLPKLTLSDIAEFTHMPLPELPAQKRTRLAALGLQAQDVEQLVGDEELSVFFDTAAERLGSSELTKTAANLILNFVAGIRKDKSTWLPDLNVFVQVIKNNLPAPQAKSSILSGVMVAVTDAGELPSIAQKVVDANPSVVADYKAGKQAVLQYLVGQGMKESRGSANPEALRKALLDILG